MNMIPYVNRPAPLAWDVAAAIFGASGLEGALLDPSELSTLFQNVAGTIPSLPGDPVGLVLDKSGNGINLSQTTAAARPTLARMPLTGRRNLLTWTEDASKWANPSSVFSAKEDGFFEGVLTADAQSGTNFSSLYPVGSSIDRNVTIVRSVEFKAAEDGSATHIMIGSPNNGYTRVFVNIATGEVINVGGLTGGTIRKAVATPLDDGGWRLETWTDVTSGAANLQSGFGWGVWDGTTSFLPGNAGQSVLVRKPSFAVVEGLGFEDSIPYQRVTSAYDVTAAGVPDTYDLTYDLTDDALTTTFLTTITGDILIAGRNGSIIEPFSGNTLTIGPDTYTGGTSGILSAIGGIVGVLVIDRSLTQAERDTLVEYYKGKGAGDLLP